MIWENKEYKTWETERLIIRPTLEEDDAFIFQLLNSEKWINNIGDRSIHSTQDARNFIQSRIHPHLRLYGYSNNTVIRKSDGVKVGTCGLYRREGLDGIDVGYALLPEMENQGYAREAVQKIVEAGFNDFRFEQIGAYILPTNERSIHLIERLGFNFIDQRRFTNDDTELNYYALVNPNTVIT